MKERVEIKDVKIEPSRKFFLFHCTAGELCNLYWVAHKTDYFKNKMLGYFSPMKEKFNIIGVCNKQGPIYNAKVLSHEFLHHLLHEYISPDANHSFDVLCFPPVGMDGLGNSRIGVSEVELDKNLKERKDEIYE